VIGLFYLRHLDPTAILKIKIPVYGKQHVTVSSTLVYGVYYMDSQLVLIRMEDMMDILNLLRAKLIVVLYIAYIALNFEKFCCHVGFQAIMAQHPEISCAVQQLLVH